MGRWFSWKYFILTSADEATVSSLPSGHIIQISLKKDVSLSLNTVRMASIGKEKLCFDSTSPYSVCSEVFGGLRGWWSPQRALQRPLSRSWSGRGGQSCCKLIRMYAAQSCILIRVLQHTCIYTYVAAQFTHGSPGMPSLCLVEQLETLGGDVDTWWVCSPKGVDPIHCKEDFHFQQPKLFHKLTVLNGRCTSYTRWRAEKTWVLCSPSRVVVMEVAGVGVEPCSLVAGCSLAKRCRASTFSECRGMYYTKKQILIAPTHVPHTSHFHLKHMHEVHILMFEHYIFCREYSFAPVCVPSSYANTLTNTHSHTHRHYPSLCMAVAVTTRCLGVVNWNE